MTAENNQIAEQTEKRDVCSSFTCSDSYTSDYFALLRDDCMQWLTEYPDNHFDLAIVDPPYGINASSMNMGDGYYGKGRKDRLNQGAGKLKTRNLQIMKSDWDERPPRQDYFDELRRISRNQIIWGGNYFPLPPTRGIVCWDKMQPWPNFSAWEMAWTSFDSPAKLFQFNNAISGKTHPTQKPIKLYEWLLRNYAKEGDTILDTHLGSGSSVIACYNMGHHLTGFEIDQDYFTAMKRRIEQHMKQQRLFDGGDV